MSMTIRDRAKLRADHLRGEVDYHRWLDARLALIHETWVPAGKIAVPPDKSTIRDILRDGVLGAKSLSHLCMVFKTVPGYWYLDDDNLIHEAARTVEQRGLVVSPDEAGEWLAKRSAQVVQATPEENPHRRGAEMAAAFI